MDGGVLIVSDGTAVSLACREAVQGNSQLRLESEVLDMRAAHLDAVRRVRVEQTRIHAHAVRQMLRHLRPQKTHGVRMTKERTRDATHRVRVAKAARRAANRDAMARDEPEPSPAARLGQIGILGWTIVLPTLVGLLLGCWLDRLVGTRVSFSAPLLMIGAAFGLWSAWKWMHQQQRRGCD